jgi:hypothetical protein
VGKEDEEKKKKEEADASGNLTRTAGARRELALAVRKLDLPASKQVGVDRPRTGAQQRQRRA